MGIQCISWALDKITGISLTNNSVVISIFLLVQSGYTRLNVTFAKGNKLIRRDYEVVRHLPLINNSCQGIIVLGNIYWKQKLNARISLVEYELSFGGEATKYSSKLLFKVKSYTRRRFKREDNGKSIIGNFFLISRERMT